MLYKCPGPHFLHGIKCDYIIVPSNQADQWIAKGWSYSPAEAEKLIMEPELEPVEEKSKLKLKYEDFSDLEKDNIRRDKRAMKLLAEIHNTGYHVIRKIKGKK